MTNQNAITVASGHTKTIGAALGVLAYGLFATHDALMKLLVVDLPVWQVLFFRSFITLIIVIAIGRRALVARVIASPWKGALVLRGLVNLAAWLCFYSAARSLPLAQLLCLYFGAPLMVTVMATRLLGEQVTRSRWISVTIGFVGILFATDPLGVPASFPTILALIAACLWAYSMILMRQIAQHEDSMVQMLSNNLVLCVGTGIVCLVLGDLRPVSVDLTLAGLISVGLIGGLAQFLVFEAARRIPASVMATIEYSALVWAFVLGYLIWSDIPTLPVWLGAALIILAGAIVITAERKS